MPDYSKGKIYTIRSHQTDDIYIGSTTQSLSERLRGHKRSWYCWIKSGRCIKDIRASYEILDFDDAYIELLEDYPCERKEQLHKREGQLIREMDCVNKRIAGRTDKEYREENRERISGVNRLYREKNKERIKAFKSRVFVCECGSKYTHSHKSRHLRSKKHQSYIASLNNT